MTLTLTFRELANDAEFSAMWPLIAQLGHEMNESEFHVRLLTMRASGYRCMAAFEGEKIIALAGFWMLTRFWCGKNVDIDNVIVDEAHRNAGLGNKLMERIEAVAKAEGCNIAVLDTYASNHASHRFYIRNGYDLVGYHFVKSLQDARLPMLRVTSRRK